MNAHDLFQLGRRLMKIGEDAMRPPGSPVTPPGVRLILMDVFAHPDSSIGEIAERTGLPQSHVSESVARFRDVGAFTTRPDPADGRRTLVAVADTLPETVARLGAVPVDQVLVEALGDTEPETAAALVASLGALAARLGLNSRDPAGIVRQLMATRDEG